MGTVLERAVPIPETIRSTTKKMHAGPTLSDPGSHRKRNAARPARALDLQPLTERMDPGRNRRPSPVRVSRRSPDASQCCDPVRVDLRPGAATPGTVAVPAHGHKERHRRRGRTVHRERFRWRTGVHDRPSAIEERAEFGHWESNRVRRQGQNPSPLSIRQNSTPQRHIIITQPTPNRFSTRPTGGRRRWC